MKIKNILLQVDSYKYSHYKQYPPNTEVVYSYIESRGGKYDKTLFFGLQAYLKEYLSTPITQQMIDEAAKLVEAHIGPNVFNRDGWEYILTKYNGVLPLRIKAVKEGTVVPTSNVLVTVENTDPQCFWLTSFIETSILRAVWYPTTVATQSWVIKQLIKGYLERTGDPIGLDFKLHDFGGRGVSSSESAGLGGMSHLVNFKGTDTVEALMYAKRYYNEPMAAFSIPAAEHSSITSWGKDREVDAYRNMIKQFGGEGKLVAVVSDSYDIINACKMWGTELKQDVIDSKALVVIRPDSGHPETVVLEVVRELEKGFGSTVNSKGFKVLNNVRVIQGDGINEQSIRGILLNLEMAGYSADNVAFGMGGALLQILNRDTQKFAMKASAARIDGEWVDVFKDPVTDSGKRSKKGRVTLVTNGVGDFESVANFEMDGNKQVWEALETVWENGELKREQTFAEIRELSNSF